MAREQRRLAAIVAADVVGYSRLMGRDESGTLARLREHRKERFEPTLARHGGRLVKLTGDGALAEFPSAVDALSAAIEFQQTMCEANRDQPDDTAMIFRIGLHLGDLIVDGEDLYGDGVNVAARLEAEAPAGGIVVSYNVRDAVDGRLKASLHDLGELTLKNIERPVRAFRVGWDAVDWTVSTKLSAPSPAIAMSPSTDAPLALPDKPSIAVLPFQNMSGDPEQEYFVDGLVEDIISALSKFKSLFVIARNSSFTYKGKAVDIKQVGRELGVRYVLEGSVRKAAGRVRTSAQLVETGAGSHVWVDRYDRALADIFEVQDELTNRIVTHLQPAIAVAETERAQTKGENELTAWDCVLRASALLRTNDPAHIENAEAFLKKAITARKDFAPAYAKMSACRLKANYMTLGRNEVALDEALQYARRAVTSDPDDALGYDALASVLQRMRKMEASVVNAKKAIELSPALMAAHGTLVSSLAFCGRASEAIEAFGISERLSPRDPERSGRLMGLLIAQFVAANYNEVVRIADEHILLQPKWHGARYYRVASLALLGRLDDARQAMRDYLEIVPDYTISRYMQIRMLQRPEDSERVIEGMRRAGLPE